MASQIRDKRDKRIPLYVKGWVCKILKETRQLRWPVWQCVSYWVPCQEDLFWNGGTRWQQTRRKTFTAPRRFLRTTRRVGKPNCLYFTASIAFIYIISVSRLSVWLVTGVTFPLPCLTLAMSSSSPMWPSIHHGAGLENGWICRCYASTNIKVINEAKFQTINFKQTQKHMYRGERLKYHEIFAFLLSRRS